MWTHASLEAESEGLVEHSAFPFSSPSTRPNTVHLSMLQPGWEGEKKVAEISRRSPKNAAFSVDNDGPCALRS